MSVLMILLGVSAYSQLGKWANQDVMLWLICLQSWLLIPVYVWYGILTRHTINAKGITRWRWQGFGKPSRAIAHLDWSDVESVEPYPHWGRALKQVKFSGIKNDKKTIIWIPFGIDPGWRAVRYAVQQLPTEKVSKSLRNLLERSQKKWYQRIF